MQQTFLSSHKTSLFYGFSLIIIFFIALLSARTVAFTPSIIGLIGFLVLYVSNKKAIAFPKKELLILAPALLLILISCLWAPNFDFAMEKTGKIALILLSGSLFIGLSRSVSFSPKFSFLKILIFIQLINAIFFTSELLTEHQITHALLKEYIYDFKYNRSHIIFGFLTLFILFLLKVSTIEKKQKIFFYCITLLGALVLFYFSKSQTAQLTFLAGLFFLFIFPIKNVLYSRILLTVIVIFTVVLPFTIAPIKNSLSENFLQRGVLREASIIHRLEVWNYATEKTFDSPIYGQGLEALRFMKNSTWMKNQEANNALHAHNSILQIWAEFGLIGIVLAILFFIYTFKQIEKISDINQRRLYMTIFMSCFVCSLTGYGLWQSWQLGFFIFASGVAIALGRNYNALGNKNQ